MSIIFVCNLKCNRTGLNKMLNNHGLKFKYFTNTKLCVNGGFSCLVIPIPHLVQQIVIIHKSLDGCFNTIKKSEKNMCDGSQFLEKLHFLVYIFAEAI